MSLISTKKMVCITQSLGEREGFTKVWVKSSLYVVNADEEQRKGTYFYTVLKVNLLTRSQSICDKLHTKFQRFSGKN